MKKILLYILSIVLIGSVLIIPSANHPVHYIIIVVMVILGVKLLKKAREIPKQKRQKEKLYKHRHTYIVRGAYKYQRQREIGSLYRRYATEGQDGEKTATIRNIKLESMPKEYDPNAIAVYLIDTHVGYIPQGRTSEINLDYPYKGFATIVKDPQEYNIELYVEQKLPYKR